MKIGIYDPYLDTLSGGEKYMLSLASCLARSHEVYVLWNLAEEKKIREAAHKKLGIDLKMLNFYSNIFDKKIKFLDRLNESKKFDALVYLSDGSIPLVGTDLYVHFQFPIEWVRPSLKMKLKLLFVKRIICNSVFTKSFIDKKMGVDSLVLYPPVDYHSVSNVKKENIILHVGRFDVNRNEVNYKKQDVMIGAFEKMVDSGLRNWRLKLAIGLKAGDESKLNKLREASKDYPIDFLVNISNTELWENYAKAKIYWHATGYGEDIEKHPEKAEHFGISTVEAMESGVVPVVFNAGGQKEIVENGKNGYLWSTLEDFVDKTEKLIKDEKLLGELSLRAVEKSKKFTGDRFCLEVEKILNK